MDLVLEVNIHLKTINFIINNIITLNIFLLDVIKGLQLKSFKVLYLRKIYFN